MITWLSLHIVDIVLVFALVAIVSLIVMKGIKDKKAGKSSCGCNCSGCAMSGECHCHDK
ncbi:MAG: FeoB-associated Cys-rich membrane protein [Lachnospiraceae bacterium]|nr:FeoB-associated Cys-rich membrane protein [Lachnospiraceae bacterium]